jgi:hypothetical protein
LQALRNTSSISREEGNPLSRAVPITWNATEDKEIAAAISRQAKLHEEWRESQRDAQRAVEAIAGARAASDEARSDALAAGRDDPGAVDTAEVERAAEAASERRDLLSSAFVKARATALRTADEREAAWQREADKALGVATGTLVGTLDTLAAALDDWQAARNELSLAQSSALRERGRRLTATMAVDRLRGANGAPMPLATVIEALRALADTPAPGREPQPIEVEPERVSESGLREVRALGGVVLPHGE